MSYRSPTKKAPSKSPLNSGNTPILVGGLFLGVGIIFLMRSKSSSVSAGPPLILHPSTDADQSTVANLIQALNGISNIPTGLDRPIPPVNPAPNPTPIPTPTPTPTPNPNPSPNPNPIPRPNPTPSPVPTPTPSNPNAPTPSISPAQRLRDALLPANLPGVNWNPGLGAYQYVGAPPATFAPPEIGMFQTAIALGSANPNNQQDVQFVANNFYQGNTSLATQGIQNAQAAQSGDWNNPVVQEIQAKVNPVGAYMAAHPGVSQYDANKALGIIP